MHTKNTTDAHSTHGASGFALVELIVALAIMLLFIVMVLVSDSRFSNKLVIKNVAHSIALSIREAQVYATSGRAVGAQFPGYGIFVETGTNAAQYILYQDSDGNGRYTNSTEIFEVRSIGSGIRITALCGETVPGTCAPAIDDLDVHFARPNPDAVLRDPDVPLVTFSKATITIQTPEGASRFVDVWMTGVVSVR